MQHLGCLLCRELNVQRHDGYRVTTCNGAQHSKKHIQHFTR